MEGLTLQVEIIPSLVEATWHVQAVSWNLHVDYKLAINSLVFFSKIPCFCHQLPPTASFPGLIIAITVHLWHLLCRIHRIKVASYTGMAKNHFAAACFSYFILTMYIYIMHTQIHTYIYIYIYIRTQMNKSISRCHPWQQRVPSSSSSSSMMESISAHDSLLVDPLRAAKLTWKVIPLTK